MSEDKGLFDGLFSAAHSADAFGNAKVIAAITDGEKWRYGYNSKKTHPFQKRFGTTEDNIFLHAEIDAIKNWIKIDSSGRYWYFGDLLRDCKLYIMRVKRDGRNGPWITGLSKPCLGCSRAITTFGIKNVYYTEDKATEFTCL